MDRLNSITEKIIGAAYAVSNTLGSGFLEKVYENAMFLELSKCGFSVKTKVITSFYDNQIVGEYFADLIVEEEIIVEIKAIKELNEIHQAQLMN
ncbi:MULTISPECIES: GxxExxY protein [unclassified Pedobacter]|uniref:GxxExxY protein n=1 Tax=unclassified Pedobacter TaxID=2628915 RepID=UPI0018F634BA|nr:MULTISPECIES: GxxExxY protein [unclassified Pedobacter]